MTSGNNAHGPATLAFIHQRLENHYLPCSFKTPKLNIRKLYRLVKWKLVCKSASAGTRILGFRMASLHL